MTQREMIIRHLKDFGAITPVEALRDYGCFRLAARIGEIREKYEIETETEHNINRFGKKIQYARYRLIV